MEKNCRYCTHNKRGYCFYHPGVTHTEKCIRKNRLLQFLLGCKIVEAPGAVLPKCRSCLNFKTDVGKELLYRTDMAWSFGTFGAKGNGLLDQIKYMEGDRWENEDNKKK